MQWVLVRCLPRLTRAAWGRVMFLLAVAGVLLGATGYLVTGQEKLALARLLPKGALAYVQARNFRALLAQWRASSVHDRYYTSDSFRAFLRSRLWAKLSERLHEFEASVGITLTEETVAAMAGTATAVALYDMGKIELVFVTELTAKQAAATPLLARKTAFEARTTATGHPYLVREVTTDGGRLRQALCVATPPGKLVVTTSEALMQRTLDNLDGKSEDCVLTTMAPTLAAAPDFTPHDLTLWTDLSRLRQQPYFGYYWVHGSKAPGLEGVEAVLADVELTREGLWERRWLLTSGRTAPASFTPQQQPVVASLLAASPFTTVETIPADAGDIPAKFVTKVVFPPPPLLNASDLPRIRVIEDTTPGTAGRYQRLDERFDRDVDDPDAPPSGPSPDQIAHTHPPDPLETELASLFRSARPTLLARLGETTTEGSAPFVTFERALALYCQQPFEAKAYESVMGRAIAQRYFIAGTVAPVSWQTTPTGVVVPRAAAPLERCGAYFVSGNLVVIASSATYAERLKARLDEVGAKSAKRMPNTLTGTHRQARLRLRALAPDYQRALRLIKLPESQELKSLEDLSDESIDFLGRNIASLLDVVEVFDLVTVESAAAGPAWIEQVRYHFQSPASRE
jgi:hypothetical protein